MNVISLEKLLTDDSNSCVYETEENKSLTPRNALFSLNLIR
jgi:hypothetical protein